MQNFIIRTAICLLIKEELGYAGTPLPLTKSQLAKILTDVTHKVFVAEQGGFVIGFVHAVHYDTLFYPPLKNIMGVAVSSKHKRMGIGKALFACVEECARENGAIGIRLNSGIGRPAAHAFYAACGYSELKTQKQFRKMF